MSTISQELSRLKTDNDELEEAKKSLSGKVDDLQKKCDDLSEANGQLSAERNDAIQVWL